MSDVVGKAGTVVVDDPGYDPAAPKWWEDESLRRREGPIVIIMSRLHEADLAGAVEIEPGEFQYIDLPMEWPMSEMVERVARAICAKLYTGEDPNDNRTWEDLAKVARAAISAMREPTEAMLAATTDCGCDHYVDPSAGVHPDQWQAMIDAALK